MQPESQARDAVSKHEKNKQMTFKSHQSQRGTACNWQWRRQHCDDDGQCRCRHRQLMLKQTNTHTHIWNVNS